jgi:tRNA A37 methylthiotransferase MiaB
VVFLVLNSEWMKDYMDDAKAKLTKLIASVAQAEPNARFRMATSSSAEVEADLPFYSTVSSWFRS